MFGFNLDIRPRPVAIFDRSVIRRRWRRSNRNPVMRAGMLVRRIARQSIKRRKLGGKPGPAGGPPRSRQPGKTPPFKMIYAVPQHMGTSVVVGMVGFSRMGFGPAVPGLHEHGGRARRRVRTNMRQRRRKSGRYGRIKYDTATKAVKYPRRPFMRPALRKARSRLPTFWRNSVSR